MLNKSKAYKFKCFHSGATDSAENEPQYDEDCDEAGNKLAVPYPVENRQIVAGGCLWELAQLWWIICFKKKKKRRREIVSPDLLQGFLISKFS